VIAYVAGQDEVMIDVGFPPISQDEAFGFQHHVRTSQGVVFGTGS
jgi:hypothetical protein